MDGDVARGIGLMLCGPAMVEKLMPARSTNINKVDIVAGVQQK
jgi:hypothetical protein